MMTCVRFASIVVLTVALTGCVGATNDPAGPNGEAATFDPMLLGDWITTEAKTEIVYDYRTWVGGRVISSSPPREEYTEEEFTRLERKAADSNTYLMSLYRVPNKPKSDGDKPEPIRKPDEIIEAHLVKLGESLFVSYPIAGRQHAYYGIVKIEHRNNFLRTSTLNLEFLKMHPELVPQRPRDSSSTSGVLITADAPQLREFLRSNADVSDVWIKSEKVARRRQKPRE